MFRRKVGLIALSLLSIGGILWFVPFEGHNLQAIRGACQSIGIGMSLLWLAEPQLKRMPFWLPITIVVIVAVLIARPKLIPLGFAAIVILWLIRPRRRE
jgi:hypothetical protein